MLVSDTSSFPQRFRVIAFAPSLSPDGVSSQWTWLWLQTKAWADVLEWMCIIQAIDRPVCAAGLTGAVGSWTDLVVSLKETDSSTILPEDPAAGLAGWHSRTSDAQVGCSGDGDCNSGAH